VHRDLLRQHVVLLRLFMVLAALILIPVFVHPRVHDPRNRRSNVREAAGDRDDDEHRHRHRRRSSEDHHLANTQVSANPTAKASNHKHVKRQPTIRRSCGKRVDDHGRL
jgi:hypothetical protein